MSSLHQLITKYSDIYPNDKESLKILENELDDCINNGSSFDELDDILNMNISDYNILLGETEQIIDEKENPKWQEKIGKFIDEVRIYLKNAIYM